MIAAQAPVRLRPSIPQRIVLMAVPRAAGRRLILCVLAILVGNSLALSQSGLRPELPDEEKFGRPADEFALSYCVDPRDPGWEMDNAIGQAIADRLLLEARPHIVADTSQRAEIDDLYRHLLADCRIYFGFKLIPGAYPDWLTVTRPYYETGYVFVGPASAPSRLADIPAHEPIGSTLGSSGDFRLVQYNNSLPADRRWKRFPFGSDASAMEAVVDGTVTAALVWAPAFAQSRKSDSAIGALKVIASEPLNIPAMQVGAVLLSEDTFLRSNVDKAIEAIVADGTVEKILKDQGMPGTPPRSQ